MRKLVQLSEADNVAIAIIDLHKQDIVELNGCDLKLCDHIPTGHKVAIREIATGDKVIRCAMPIGSATANIPVGALAHVHNLKSDYTPTFTREDANVNIDRMDS